MSKKKTLIALTSCMFGSGPYHSDILNVNNGPQGSAFYQPKRKHKKGKRK